MTEFINQLDDEALDVFRAFVADARGLDLDLIDYADDEDEDEDIDSGTGGSYRDLYDTNPELLD